MPRGSVSKILSDEEFIIRFQREGATNLAKQMRVNERAIYARRRNIEAKIGEPLLAPRYQANRYGHRVDLTVKNGVVLIGSDAHIWPGPPSTALRAFKKFCADLKPAAVIANGDWHDFPRISRYDLSWESAPSPQQEIEAVRDHLSDIERAVGKAHKVWPIGNHDARFEVYFANHASEMKGIKGVHLADHHALWQKALSCWINGDVVIKHRFKGGIHATHNNTMWAGKTMITGHLHSQKVTPFTDYNGTRYGVDTGCLADPDHKAFASYTEDAPLNWRSGFAVLTFVNGQMLMPELVSKWSDNYVQFRGELIRV